MIRIRVHFRDVGYRTRKEANFHLVSNMDKTIGVDHIYYSVLVSFNHDKQFLTFLYLVAIASVVYFYINYKIKRRRLEKIVDRYGGPKGYPLIGNAPEFLGAPKDVLKKAIALMNSYKSPFKIWLLHKPYVVISTPEDFQTAAFKTLEKDSSYKFVVDMLGDGVFTSEVERWRRNRRVINPAFNPTILFHYFLQIFNEQNTKLVKRLKHEVGTGKHFDLWPYVTQTSIMTICETAMGYKTQEDTTEVMKFGNALMKSAELVSKRFYKPWLMPSLIFTAYRYLLGYGNVFNIVQNLPLKMLRKRRELFHRMKTENYVCAEQEKAMRNFIDILLNFHEVNANFTDKELADEVISIMFGGSETNAVTNCFCMLMLGMRQDIQEKVNQELYDVFGDGNRLPELEDLAKLPYLEQCIKETLRRFPVVPVILRHAREDIPISNGNIIPAGCNIALGIYGIHHDPEIYPNPEIWDPSNFEHEKVASRHKSSFVPFSTGPRGCVGQKYAMISMKAQLSTLIRNFKITTDITMDDIELNVDMIIRSLHGYQIKLEYRHGESLF